MTTHLKVCESQTKINVFLDLILKQKSPPIWFSFWKLPHWGHSMHLFSSVLTCCWKFLSTKLKEAIKVHCWPKWPEWPPWWPNEMASVSMGKWWRDTCNKIHSYKTWEISVTRYIQVKCRNSLAVRYENYLLSNCRLW